MAKSSSILPPHFKQLLAPKLPDHPLLAEGRFYFTLPKELLEAVVDAVGGESRFDKDLLRLDRELASRNGDHSHSVGFRNNRAITYAHLAQPPSLKTTVFNLSKEEKAHLGWAPAQFTQLQSLTDLNARSEWMHGICQGYCGWLLLNPTFIHEEAQFLEKWRDVIREVGLDELLMCPVNKRPDPKHVEFAKARMAWLERWQLTALAGPFLPSPLTPQIPVMSSTLIPDFLKQGTLFFLPSIFPLPERQLLRQMIEDAMRPRQMPEHLKGWIELVESDSIDKKRINRLGRIFRLQHFWRTLFARHAQAAAGKLALVRCAFASFLIPGVGSDAGAESIEKDLGELSKAHGGPGWFRRPSPCDPVA